MKLPDEERLSVLNLKYKDLGKNTFLYMAVKREDLEMVKYLLEKGVKDDEAYSLAMELGGRILSLMEPKLANVELVPGYCHICTETGALVTLDCGHSYCYFCLQNWAKEGISETPPNPHCPGCAQPIIHLYYFLTNAELEQYYTRVLHFTLSCISAFTWCKNCPNGFILEDSHDCKTITCSDCHYQWCRNCSLALHSETNCEEAMARQTNENRENMKWLRMNSKKCPKCQTTIEKNNGCNHMTCRLCKFEFCWNCLSVYIPGQPCCIIPQ